MVDDRCPQYEIIQYPYDLEVAALRKRARLAYFGLLDNPVQNAGFEHQLVGGHFVADETALGHAAQELAHLHAHLEQV